MQLKYIFTYSDFATGQIKLPILKKPNQKQQVQRSYSKKCDLFYAAMHI